MNKSPRRLFIRRQSGFSLVEMIGVLAIIAILAVVIVPKVFSTIASSRITSAVGSVTSMKSAVTEFAGKHGTIPLAGATLRLDDLLVKAGMLDSRFSVKIGNPPSGSQGGAWTFVNGAWVGAPGGISQAAAPVQSRLVSVARGAAAAGVDPAAAGGSNYYLSPSNPIVPATDSLPAGSTVVSAVIAQVTATEAWELSRRIDGDNLSAADAAGIDNRGKVVYPAGAGLKNVLIYIAHQ